MRDLLERHFSVKRPELTTFRNSGTFPENGHFSVPVRKWPFLAVFVKRYTLSRGPLGIGVRAPKNGTFRHFGILAFWHFWHFGTLPESTFQLGLLGRHSCQEWPRLTARTARTAISDSFGQTEPYARMNSPFCQFCQGCTRNPFSRETCQRGSFGQNGQFWPESGYSWPKVVFDSCTKWLWAPPKRTEFLLGDGIPSLEPAMRYSFTSIVSGIGFLGHSALSRGATPPFTET